MRLDGLITRCALLLALFVLAPRPANAAVNTCASITVLANEFTGAFLRNEQTGALLLGTQGSPIIPVVSSRDVVDYLLKFDSSVQANADPTVGPFLSSKIGFEIDLIPDITLNSTMAAPGFWVIVTQLGPINSTLYTHGRVQLVNDRSLAISTGKGLICSNIPTTNVQITIPTAGAVYTQRGLQ